MYTERILLCHFIYIYGEQWISVVIIEEIKTKITTEFKVRERSERDGIKEKLARNKDSEVQKHASFIKKRLDTIWDMKYEIQEMIIDSNVEDEIVDKWVNITNEKFESIRS